MKEEFDIKRTWVEINLDALIHNLKFAKETTGKKVMCVIKGNAHGHGAVECGQALEANGAYAFAVACLQEGIELRKSGIKAPILILGWTPVEYVNKILEYNLMQNIYDEEYAIKLDESAKEFGGTLEVHIELDTGMSRAGIFAQQDQEEAAKIICEISTFQNIKISGLFTHFAAADMVEKDEYTKWQLNNYRKVLEELELLGFDQPVLNHTGNSAGIMYHPETYFDMVRAGVMLYGLNPKGEVGVDSPLASVLTLKSRIAQVKELPANTHISYGCTYKTNKPMKIAVVAAGFGDSYPRSLSSKGAYAIINGQRCHQVGRVCMDMCMFDVTGINAQMGDIVTLLGGDGMTLDEIAKLTNSINCEPACLLTNRVEKVYVRDKV